MRKELQIKANATYLIGKVDSFDPVDLINNLPAAIYTTDATGTVTSFNKAAAVLWGREPLIGIDKWCGSWRIYNPDGSDLPPDECPMALALTTGKPVRDIEIIVERPDGSRVNVLPHPDPVYDKQGNVTGAINLLVDITELKKARKTLSEIEMRFRNIADLAPVMMLMTDMNYQGTFLNKCWLEFTGQDETEHHGKNWINSVHEADRKVLTGEFKAASESKRSFSSEFRLKHAGGSYRWVQSKVSPMFNDDKSIYGYIAACVDVTDQKRMRTELEDGVAERTRALETANRELERSNSELEQFAYAASHDLQEPLRKISSFSNIILENKTNVLSDSSRDYFNRMIEASKRMNHLINDLLSYSRVTATVDDDRKYCDLNQILEESKTALRLLIEETGTTIIAGHLPEAKVIPFQFQQVFQNLISNAIKFRKPGQAPSICITASMGHDNAIHLKFADEGIGFDMEDAESIFDLFRRLHGKNQYPGTGIGLSICKKIVQNHEGTIYAQSQPGKGSTFHILLPS